MIGVDRRDDRPRVDEVHRGGKRDSAPRAGVMHARTARMRFNLSNPRYLVVLLFSSPSQPSNSQQQTAIHN